MSDNSVIFIITPVIGILILLFYLFYKKYVSKDVNDTKTLQSSLKSQIDYDTYIQKQNDLREKLDKLSAEKNDFKSEIEKLKDQLGNKKDELHKLEQTITNNEVKCSNTMTEHLQSDTEAKTKNIILEAKLRQEILELKSKYDTLNAEVKNKENAEALSKITNERNLKDEQKKVAEKQQQLLEKNDAIAALNKEITDLKNQITTKQNEFETMKKEKQQDIERLNKDLKDAKSQQPLSKIDEINKLRNSLLDKDAIITEKSNTLNTANEKLSQLQVEYQIFKNTHNTCDINTSKIASLEETIKVKNAQIENDKSHLIEHTAECTKQINEKTNRINQMEKEKLELEKAIVQKNAAYTQLQSEYNDVVNNCKKHTAEHADEIQDLKTNLTTAKQRHSDCQIALQTQQNNRDASLTEKQREFDQITRELKHKLQISEEAKNNYEQQYKEQVRYLEQKEQELETCRREINAANPKVFIPPIPKLAPMPTETIAPLKPIDDKRTMYIVDQPTAPMPPATNIYPNINHIKTNDTQSHNITPIAMSDSPDMVKWKNLQQKFNDIKHTFINIQPGLKEDEFSTLPINNWQSYSKLEYAKLYSYVINHSFEETTAFWKFIENSWQTGTQLAADKKEKHKALIESSEGRRVLASMPEFTQLIILSAICSNILTDVTLKDKYPYFIEHIGKFSSLNTELNKVKNQILKILMYFMRSLLLNSTFVPQFDDSQKVATYVNWAALDNNEDGVTMMLSILPYLYAIDILVGNQNVKDVIISVIRQCYNRNLQYTSLHSHSIDYSALLAYLHREYDVESYGRIGGSVSYPGFTKTKNSYIAFNTYDTMIEQNRYSINPYSKTNQFTNLVKITAGLPAKEIGHGSATLVQSIEHKLDLYNDSILIVCRKYNCGSLDHGKPVETFAVYTKHGIYVQIVGTIRKASTKYIPLLVQTKDHSNEFRVIIDSPQNINLDQKLIVGKGTEQLHVQYVQMASENIDLSYRILPSVVTDETLIPPMINVHNLVYNNMNIHVDSNVIAIRYNSRKGKFLYIKTAVDINTIHVGSIFEGNGVGFKIKKTTKDTSRIELDETLNANYAKTFVCA